MPGVAVSAEGSQAQALTDGLGEYAIAYTPGRVILTFAKTGFTSGRLEIDATDAQGVNATDVQLWRLPMSKGVYLFEAPEYTRLGTTVPVRYQTKGLGTLYGIEKWQDVATLNKTPLLIAYRTSQYEARLYRLELLEFEVDDAKRKDSKVKAWVPVEAIQVAMTAIDEPLRQLMQVRYDGELNPGIYAVHWGSLDGQAQIENNSAYLFRIPATEGEAPPVQPNEETVDLPTLSLDPE